MIIVVKKDATPEQVAHLIRRIEEVGLKVHLSRGEYRTIIGVIGDESRVRNFPFLAIPGVESATPILKPYKLASREFTGKSSVVSVDGVEVGGRAVRVIAGPCSVESREMLLEIARAVKQAGATLLRGGAFKPRTSPYSFQGLGKEALRYLQEAKRETGLPIVTEVLDPRDVELVAEFADLLQIGARNMQNFNLLKEVGRARKPVLLKRGMMATVKECLLSAEYIMTQGNLEVVLCERGIRTFEEMTRNTLDLSAVVILKRESHLPVIVDPSHATGRWDLIPDLARAAVAAGADGLMVEVHPNPEVALSDGDQALLPETFDRMMQDLRAVAQAVGRDL